MVLLPQVVSATARTFPVGTSMSNVMGHVRQAKHRCKVRLAPELGASWVFQQEVSVRSRLRSSCPNHKFKNAAIIPVSMFGFGPTMVAAIMFGRGLPQRATTTHDYHKRFLRVDQVLPSVNALCGRQVPAVGDVGWWC